MAASWCALRGSRQLALPTPRLRAPVSSIALRKTALSPFNACRRCLNTGSKQPARRGVYTSTLSEHGEPHPHDAFQPLDTFPRRHIGPSPGAAEQMLATLDPPVASLDEFVAQVLPEDVLSRKDMKLSSPNVDIKLDRDNLHGGLGETDMLKLLGEYRKQIDVSGKTYLGTGYNPTIVPPVILRNVLENPAWYTSYTPYQPEISQGRLESLLNFQTLTADLTGLEFANASVLDEATAAAEAMTMSMTTLPLPRQKKPGKAFVV